MSDLWSFLESYQLDVTSDHILHEQYPQTLMDYEPYFNGYSDVTSTEYPVVQSTQVEKPFTAKRKRLEDDEYLQYPAELDESPPAKKMHGDLTHITDGVLLDIFNPKELQDDDSLKSLALDFIYAKDTSEHNAHDPIHESSKPNIQDAVHESYETSSLTLAPPASPLGVEFIGNSHSYRVLAPPVSTMAISLPLMERPISPVQTQENPVEPCPESVQHKTQVTPSLSKKIPLVLLDGSESSPWEQQINTVIDGPQLSPWEQQIRTVFPNYQQASLNYNNHAEEVTVIHQSGYKNNHCNICTKNFGSTSKLNIHMKTHIRAHPFICDTCNKGFPSASNLDVHISRVHKLHIGEKPFPCTWCNRRFSVSKTRLIHMLTDVCMQPKVKRRDTYPCPEGGCNFKCEKSNFLVKHVRETHPEYIESLGI